MKTAKHHSPEVCEPRGVHGDRDCESVQCARITSAAAQVPFSSRSGHDTDRRHCLTPDTALTIEAWLVQRRAQGSWRPPFASEATRAV